MNDFSTLFVARSIGLPQAVCSILMSFILCSVIACVYRWTFQGLSYSRSFVHTMILGGMIVAMLIMAIGNNLARGLGILGTLAIVRFRTPIRDSRDMVFLFASLGIGIACGASVYGIAIIGTVCISAAALFLHWSPFASRREYEGLLRFLLPSDATCDDQIRDVLQRCCSASFLIAMREAAQGELTEYSYQVRLIDPSYQADIVDGMHQIEEVKDASLLMQRTTVEL